AQLRPCIMIHHLKTHFNLTEEYASEVNCCKSASLNHLPIHFDLWHNPKVEKLFVKTPPYLGAHGTFTLYDFAGNKIDDFPFSGVSGKSEIVIPAQNIAVGAYFLVFNTCESTMIQKIVITP